MRVPINSSRIYKSFPKWYFDIFKHCMLLLRFFFSFLVLVSVIGNLVKMFSKQKSGLNSMGTDRKIFNTANIWVYFVLASFCNSPQLSTNKIFFLQLVTPCDSHWLLNILNLCYCLHLKNSSTFLLLLFWPINSFLK